MSNDALSIPSLEMTTVHDAVIELLTMNRQDTVIATVAREAMDDIDLALNLYGQEELPLLRHLLHVLKREEAELEANRVLTHS